MPKMTAQEVEDFIFSHFPTANQKRHFLVEKLEEMRAQVRMIYHQRQLRPGGTISGPALMALADTAMWVVLTGMIGPVAHTVTTSLNINFLRKPDKKDVIAEVRLLKLGKRLAVGDVVMYSDGEAQPVAQASVTYSIPPHRE
ncbi:MAG: PaaI family thioesterase [Acidobacteria bacterium]|nr:PaaI family thioesterase [Acidobacteriota bacterium]